jgi:YVTN family beta-propeller protein
VLLVANKADATLSVLELPGGRVLATLPTAIGPHEVAISPSGRRAVVTGYGTHAIVGQTLTLVDVPSLSVVRTIDLGASRRPHGAAFLDERRLVVTSEVAGAVAIVDLDAGTVAGSIATGGKGSHMLALAPGGQRAYTANIGSGTITAIDLVAMTAAPPAPAIEACEGIAITLDGRQVWTASLAKDRIAVLDAATLAPIAELPAAGLPIRLTPTPDGRSMLVANAQGSALQLIDVASRSVATIPLPPARGDTAAPVGTAMAPDGATAYVALVAEDRVAVVDLRTRAVTGHLATGRAPDGLGYSAVFVPR